jgi:tetratricopeptide (TPR) repeat protein
MLYNQGVELMLAKRFREAQAKFEQAIQKNPRLAEAHNNLGYTLRKQGPAHFQESLEHYNTAIELKPKLAEAYMYRGILYTEMGRKSDAQADLATLQKMNPTLAKELAEVMETGKEEDRVYGLSTRSKAVNASLFYEALLSKSEMRERKLQCFSTHNRNRWGRTEQSPLHEQKSTQRLGLGKATAMAKP